MGLGIKRHNRLLRMDSLADKELKAYLLCPNKKDYIKGLEIRKDSLEKGIIKQKKEIDAIEQVLRKINAV